MDKYNDIRIPSVYWENSACAHSVYQASLDPFSPDDLYALASTREKGSSKGQFK